MTLAYPSRPWAESFFSRCCKPEGFDEQNMTIGRQMMAPSDKTRSDRSKTTAPFAGAMMLSFGYNARRGDTLRTHKSASVLWAPPWPGKPRTGGMTPSASTNSMAGDTNCATSLCCSCCTNAERESSGKKTSAVGAGSDPPLGGSHNFATYANVGGELAPWVYACRTTRAPHRCARLEKTPRPCARPLAATGTAPVRGTRRSLGFADITLDGNTFQSPVMLINGHRGRCGAMASRSAQGNWRIAIARYHRTRELVDKGNPGLRNVTVGRRSLMQIDSP